MAAREEGDGKHFMPVKVSIMNEISERACSITENVKEQAQFNKKWY